MRIKLIPDKQDNKIIYYATLFLLLFSVVMVASASVGITSKQNDAVIVNLVRQSVYYTISYLLMMFFYYNFNLRLARGLLPFFGILITVLLAATLIFSPMNGSRAWLRIMDFSLQPSEFVKVFVILYIALKLTRFTKKKYDFWDIFKWPLLVFFTWFLIVAWLQSDLGTAVSIGMISAICLLVVPGANFRWPKFWIKLVFIGGFVLLIVLATPFGRKLIDLLPIAHYQKLRFIGFSNPFFEIDRGTYQLYQSLRTFSRGKYWGVGFGNSQQKFGYLPEARTDFILPIIVEELGLLGILLVIVPYCLIIFRLFKQSLQVQENNEKVIFIGTIAYLFTHFLLNVGGVSAIIPMTGVPLLLVSSGGSSTMSIMMLLGMCQNISRKNQRSQLDESD